MREAPEYFTHGRTSFFAQRATIFCPRAWIADQRGYGYGFRHELCHVAQARRWGFLGYWRRHLAARLRTRSLLAKDDPVEVEAYAAERRFIDARS